MLECLNWILAANVGELSGLLKRHQLGPVILHIVGRRGRRVGMVCPGVGLA